MGEVDHQVGLYGIEELEPLAERRDLVDVESLCSKAIVELIEVLPIRVERACNASDNRHPWRALTVPMRLVVLLILANAVEGLVLGVAREEQVIAIANRLGHLART